MKKLLFITMLFLSAASFGQNRFIREFQKADSAFNDYIKSQDTVRINHVNYTTVFSKSLHYPIFVSWWDTKEKVSCPEPLLRVNNFYPDPYLQNETNLNPYYEGSGFDRGHNSDCEDNLCLGRQVETECFYYSNMTPQWPALNRGSWKSLEIFCRNQAKIYDSVHIWCGSVGSQKKIGGKISVPLLCWKVIYIKKLKQYKAFIFNNSSTDEGNGNSGKEVFVSQIEGLTGFKFR